MGPALRSGLWSFGGFCSETTMLVGFWSLHRRSHTRTSRRPSPAMRGFRWFYGRTKLHRLSFRHRQLFWERPPVRCIRDVVRREAFLCVPRGGQGMDVSTSAFQRPSGPCCTGEDWRLQRHCCGGPGVRRGYAAQVRCQRARSETSPARWGRLAKNLDDTSTWRVTSFRRAPASSKHGLREL